MFSRANRAVLAECGRGLAARLVLVADQSTEHDERQSGHGMRVALDQLANGERPQPLNGSNAS